KLSTVNVRAHSDPLLGCAHRRPDRGDFERRTRRVLTEKCGNSEHKSKADSCDLHKLLSRFACEFMSTRSDLRIHRCFGEWCAGTGEWCGFELIKNKADLILA